MPLFYYAGRILAQLLLLVLTRRQIEGRENIPSQGPLLIVANHPHGFDPPILGTSLSRKAVFMAKDELFRSRFSAYFMRSWGAFPIHRGRIDRRALHQANQTLTQGRALVMFPEGMRSNGKQMRRAFSGSAKIAQSNNTPILPVGIIGTEQIKGITWLFKRPKITVNIGCPFHLPSASNKPSREELSHMTNDIMGQIAKLLPPEYRGYYTEKAG